MGELKVIHAYTFDEVELISTHSNGNDYYLKSEADKLIAEKDLKIKNLEKCKKWMTDHFFCEEIAAVKERRQKYKRCLAIARWCFTKSNYHFVVGRSEDGKTGMTHYRISRLYSKWHKRWLELAEQFKEDK